MFYSSYIIYHLKLEILAWDYTWEGITKLQNNCIKTIITSEYNAHTHSQYFKEQNLLITDIEVLL